MPDPDSRLQQGGRPARLLPIVRALLCQALALVIVFFLLHGFWRLAELQFTLPAAAGLQGLVAALLSWRSLPSWWRIIQLCLPLALVGALALNLPSWLFLLVFLILLALYWTAFRTRVPYYPSGPAAWEKVASLLPSGSLRIVDIGSGFGGLSFYLAGQRRDCEVTGIEIAPLPWMASALRAHWRRRRGAAVPRFVRGDYRQLNFGEYDVIFAYLSPAAMPALWQQASAQMRPGSLLLSYEFEVPGREPQLALSTPGGRVLYVWRL